MYSWFPRLHLFAAGQITVYNVYIVQACGRKSVRFYPSTTIAVSIVSSTLDNVGFVENKMSLRTWAMRPCCASTAIFVLGVGQLYC